MTVLTSTTLASEATTNNNLITVETVCRETALYCPITAANSVFAQLFESNTSFLFYSVKRRTESILLVLIWNISLSPS